MKIKKNSNQFKLSLYLHNAKHSSTFKTTQTFKEIKTLYDAMELIENLFDGETKANVTFYDGIRLAYYNGKLIIKNGYLIN